VDELFLKYDRDRTQGLDQRELRDVFNEVLARFNLGFTISQSEAEALLYELDIRHNRRIDKQELYSCLKSLVQNESSRPGYR